MTSPNKPCLQSLGLERLLAQQGHLTSVAPKQVPLLQPPAHLPQHPKLPLGTELTAIQAKLISSNVSPSRQRLYGALQTHNTNQFQTDYWRDGGGPATNVNLITMDQNRSNQIPYYDSSRIKLAATKIVQEPQFKLGKALHVSAQEVVSEKLAQGEVTAQTMVTLDPLSPSEMTLLDKVTGHAGAKDNQKVLHQQQHLLAPHPAAEAGSPVIFPDPAQSTQSSNPSVPSRHFILTPSAAQEKTTKNADEKVVNARLANPAEEASNDLRQCPKPITAHTGQSFGSAFLNPKSDAIAPGHSAQKQAPEQITEEYTCGLAQQTQQPANASLSKQDAQGSCARRQLTHLSAAETMFIGKLPRNSYDFGRDAGPGGLQQTRCGDHVQHHLTQQYQQNLRIEDNDIGGERHGVAIDGRNGQRKVNEEGGLQGAGDGQKAGGIPTTSQAKTSLTSPSKHQMTAHTSPQSLHEAALPTHSQLQQLKLQQYNELLMQHQMQLAALQFGEQNRNNWGSENGGNGAGQGQGNGRGSKMGAWNHSEQVTYPSFPAKVSNGNGKNFEQAQPPQSSTDSSQIRRLTGKQDPFNPMMTQVHNGQGKAADALTPDPRRVLKSSSPITKLIGNSSQKAKAQVQGGPTPCLQAASSLTHGSTAGPTPATWVVQQPTAPPSYAHQIAGSGQWARGEVRYLLVPPQIGSMTSQPSMNCAPPQQQAVVAAGGGAFRNQSQNRKRSFKNAHSLKPLKRVQSGHTSASNTAMSRDLQIKNGVNLIYHQKQPQNQPQHNAHRLNQQVPFIMSSEANVRMRHSDAAKLVPNMSFTDHKQMAIPQFMSSQHLVSESESQQAQQAYNDSILLHNANSSALKVKNNLNKQKSQNQQHFALSQPRAQAHGGPTAFRYEHMLRMQQNSGSAEVRFFRPRPEPIERVLAKEAAQNGQALINQQSSHQSMQNYQLCNLASAMPTTGVANCNPITITKSHDSHAIDDPVTPILLAKNELRLVRTEQRLDKTVEAASEFKDAFSKKQEMPYKVDGKEVNLLVASSPSPSLPQRSGDPQNEASSLTASKSQAKGGNGCASGDAAAKKKEQIAERQFPMAINDHDSAGQREENGIDDEQIQDALLPAVGDLNKESLETKSCEQDREPDNEDESQSIDLSVSPVKRREQGHPVEIQDEQDRKNTINDGMQSAPISIINTDKKPNEFSQFIPSHKLINNNDLSKRQVVKPGDVEQTLRQLLDLPDAQIFDCHMIMQIMRKKYNKNYMQQLGTVKFRQRDEQRTPSAWPKSSSNFNSLARKIQPFSYSIMKQKPAETYKIKFEMDASDPANFAELPPQTTAKAWTVFDVRRMTNLHSKNLDAKLEIASMTKIMTAYLCCKIMYGDMQCVFLNPKKVYFRVSSLAARVHGTSAHLRAGLRYSIYDLLVGLMLPSGNDASLVLAENFGRFLYIEGCRTSGQILKDHLESDPYDEQVSRMYMIKFIRRMNKEASNLRLCNTSFSNPHGLSDKANKSSAQDVTRLTVAALKYPLFCEIIKKYSFQSATVYDWDLHRDPSLRGMLVFQKWYNLNVMLEDPNGRYLGVKTGQTTNAGSCLCSLYVDEKRGHRYIVVVIGTNSNKHRFQETAKLVNWCIGQQIKQKQAKESSTLYTGGHNQYRW